MSQVIQGSFTTATVASPGATSAELMIPSGITTARLSISPLDASNTVKTQKRASSSASWTDQTTYNSNQSNTSVTVAANEQWRLVLSTVQAMKAIQYKFSAES